MLKVKQEVLCFIFLVGYRLHAPQLRIKYKNLSSLTSTLHEKSCASQNNFSPLPAPNLFTHNMRYTTLVAHFYWR